jgi:F-type H+/Na+-transporting ATPase subunit alpha
VLLGPSGHLVAGAEARATGRQVDTPVGEGLLGRVLDATGRALDGKGRCARPRAGRWSAPRRRSWTARR